MRIGDERATGCAADDKTELFEGASRGPRMS